MRDGRVLITWGCSQPSDLIINVDARIAYFTSFGSRRLIGFPIHKTLDSTYESILLNADNTFIGWLRRVRVSCYKKEHGLTEQQFNRLYSYLHNSIRYGVQEGVSGYLKSVEGNEYPPI